MWTDLFIFVSISASLLIVLGKAYWILVRVSENTRERGVFLGLLYCVIDGDFWLRLLNFSADFAISTFVAVGVRLFVTTRISGAIIGFITLVISIGLWVFIWQASKELKR